MAKDWKYSDDKKRIIIDPPKQTLKISGHRIAAILGFNPYKTAFQVWCECTKVLKAPFEENKYIIAGRVIEPKIINYVSERFPNVKSIEEYYGNNFDEYRYNNFKDESNIFGGVIDCVSTDNTGKEIMMICECKTSSKPQVWNNNQIPVEYLLQGALYSYLKGLDTVLFACSFLGNDDYAHPENFKVNDSNTILVVKRLNDMLFELNGKFLKIQEIMEICENWWNTYVLQGISPEFDENDKRDKEYLNILRESRPCEDSSILEMVKEANEIDEEIDNLKSKYNIDKLESRLKILKDNIKNTMLEEEVFNVGNYKLSCSVKKKFNEKEFAKKNPQLYDSYCEDVETYRLTVSKEKEGN